jgi:hypothetical protein
MVRMADAGAVRSRLIPLCQRRYKGGVMSGFIFYATHAVLAGLAILSLYYSLAVERRLREKLGTAPLNAEQRQLQRRFAAIGASGFGLLGLVGLLGLLSLVDVLDPGWVLSAMSVLLWLGFGLVVVRAPLSPWYERHMLALADRTRSHQAQDGTP